MRSRILMTGALVILVSQMCYGKKKPEPVTDSVRLEQLRDSVKQVCYNEVDFIIDQIENTYVSGRRGIPEQEWNRRVDIVYNKLNNFFDNYEGYYIYVWRYLGLLIEDTHFGFPDSGLFNREGAFKKEDNILPLWVQTWSDGTVYNVKDYTGVIPINAKIISINGYDAKELALMNRAICPSENLYAMANMNAVFEPDPAYWSNFANYLFMNGINLPFAIIYEGIGANKQDTVILPSITRGEKVKLFKTSGDKRKSKKEQGFPRKPIVYTNTGDNIGVLAINLFWGKRWSHMLLFGKDWRYKRLLKQAMRKIDRDDIENLIVDVSLNAGGMEENIFYTLNYFTDKPIDMIHTYHVTDNNREKIQTNLTRSPHIPASDREYLIGYIDTLVSGSVFRTDTIRQLQYIPSDPKHKYDGNLYVLTGNQTYSAAQMFARYCQILGIGSVAGQHCGGYNEVTGNKSAITLPYLNNMQFQVPYRTVTVCTEDNPYDYPPVDIPIEHTFDEWLNRENHSIDRLIEIIRENRN